MYNDGVGVMRGDEAVGNPGRFTAAGLVKEFLGLLRHRNHIAFGVITAFLVALSAVLAVAAAVSARGFGRLIALGVPLFIAASVLLVLGLIGRLYTGGSEDDYIRRELLAIGEDLSWLPLRNGMILAGLGAGMIVTGILGSMLARPQPVLHGLGRDARRDVV
jgi:hypothetical protein